MMRTPVKSVPNGTSDFGRPKVLNISAWAFFTSEMDCMRLSSPPLTAETLFRAKNTIMKPPTSRPIPLMVSSTAQVRRPPKSE